MTTITIDQILADLELPAGKIQAIKSLFEQQQTEIDKLNTLKETLFEEKRKWRTDKEAAENAADKAKKAALKQAGDIETLETTLRDEYQSKLEKLNKTLSERNNVIVSSEKRRIISQLAGDFIDQGVGEIMLSNMVNVMLTDDGSVSAILNDGTGKQLSTNPADFADHIKKIPGFDVVLRGVQSSGGAGAGSTPRGGGASATAGDQAFAERVKRTLNIE